MSKDMFRERERAEEEAYFHQRDAVLIERLRQKAQLAEIAHALAEKLPERGTALLKNAGGALPIDDRDVDSVAVIGSAAQANPIASTAHQMLLASAANITGSANSAQANIARLRARPVSTPRRSRCDEYQPPAMAPKSARM